MIDPETGAAQWDVLVFGSVRSPGVVRLSGNDLKFGWDIQSATATTGAVTRPTNDPLKEFDGEFELSNEVGVDGRTDFDDWDPFQKFLESMVATRTRRIAKDVFHPDLARNHITAVTVGVIGGLKLDGKGGGKITVHFLEHRPPKPLKTLPSTKTEGDKLIDAQLAEIDKLQKEHETLDGVGGKPVKIGDKL